MLNLSLLTHNLLLSISYTLHLLHNTHSTAHTLSQARRKHFPLNLLQILDTQTQLPFEVGILLYGTFSLKFNEI